MGGRKEVRELRTVRTAWMRVRGCRSCGGPRRRIPVTGSKALSNCWCRSLQYPDTVLPARVVPPHEDLLRKSRRSVLRPAARRRVEPINELHHSAGARLPILLTHTGQNCRMERETNTTARVRGEPTPHLHCAVGLLHQKIVFSRMLGFRHVRPTEYLRRQALHSTALRSLKGVGAQSPFWLMWAAHFFVEPVRMGDTVWFSPQMFVQ